METLQYGSVRRLNNTPRWLHVLHRRLLDVAHAFINHMRRQIVVSDLKIQNTGHMCLLCEYIEYTI